MRKLNLLIILFSIILLVGCSKSNSEVISTQKENKLIKKNRLKWDQLLQSSKDIKDPNYEKINLTVPNGYKDDDMSWSRLMSGNQNVIEARVINLQPELGRVGAVETKATILVKSVISGDKSLKGKLVKTEFSGGLSYAKDYFVNYPDEYKSAGINKPRDLVYSSNSKVPMPHIGQRIIVGVNLYQSEDDYHESLYKKYGLTSKNFYVINNPEVTYWVKTKGKFHLNNPAFTQSTNVNKYPKLDSVTKRINQKYI